MFRGENLEAIRCAKLRRTMVDLNPIEAMETLTAALKKHKTNDELLAKMSVKLKPTFLCNCLRLAKMRKIQQWLRFCLEH